MTDIPLQAQKLIEALNLMPHPEEGGWFRETYRAGENVSATISERSCSTAIYYLLTPETLSAMHVLGSDEVFHFYAGDPVEQLHLYPDGTGQRVVLGPDVLNGQSPQMVVPAGTWQGARLIDGGTFALLGCTVAPGFEFAD